MVQNNFFVTYSSSPSSIHFFSTESLRLCYCHFYRFVFPFSFFSLSPEGCFSEQCGCVPAGTFRVFLCCCVWKLLVAFSHTVCPSKENLEVQRERKLQRARTSPWSVWTRNSSSNYRGLLVYKSIYTANCLFSQNPLQLSLLIASNLGNKPNVAPLIS